MTTQKKKQVFNRGIQSSHSGHFKPVATKKQIIPTYLFHCYGLLSPTYTSKILAAKLLLEKAKSGKSKSKKAGKPASKAKPTIAAELGADKENNGDLEDDDDAHSIR